MSEIPVLAKAEIDTTAPVGLYRVSDVPAREDTIYDLAQENLRTGTVIMLARVRESGKPRPPGVHEFLVRPDGREVVYCEVIADGRGDEAAFTLTATT